LRSSTATVADDFVHLTLATARILSGTTGSTASRATAGLVLKALVREELLLAGREHEFTATVATGQGFVLIHDGSLQKC
jgi:hypothetical protein